ncbi:monovalent cation/H+ antiporter complex subunit F [Motiliproteus sp. SC1-56]|uniref:monovalent cation/H+ antiporter complex subunit F n=1 Tax=Motiliproteus sp. SC1-56 TaxID=2799565 RepID=UPI001A8F9C12|nr:monovalent cation/H+ antiporter complex subunit F [Motiliproteus sp. SC1-56]
MLLAAVLAILVTMVLALIRALLGPTAYDRMLASNLFGTKTVLLIAVGGHALDWPSFVDVALLYAMINFVGTLAVMRFFQAQPQPQPQAPAAEHPPGEEHP